MGEKSICYFACRYPCILGIWENSRRENSSSKAEGIRKSHQQLCTSELQDYCDLRKRFLSEYLITQLGFQIPLGEA